MGLPPKVPDHCLLYLADRADVREDEPAAQDLTQERIAEALSVRRPHVSRAMGRLGARGLVKTAKVHVRGETRRRLAYFLTEEGLRRAQALRRRLEEETVVTVDLQGGENRRRLYEVALLLPRRPRFSDLLASIEAGRLDLRRFLDRQARLKGGKVYDAREAAAPAHFRGRAAELARLDAFLEDPRARGVFLVGLPGIGKTALASRWVEGLQGRVHVLWRRVRKETTSRDVLRDVAELLRAAGRPALFDHLHRPPEGDPHAAVALLRRDLAGLRALVVLDDVHDAAEDVGQLANELLAVEGGVKLLLLARERPGFLRTEDRVRGRVWELDLDDLPGADARAMLGALGVPRDRQAGILDRCGGHPLALELAAAGQLPLEGVRRASVSWFAEEAMAQLESSALDALALAAVIGAPVALDRLGSRGPELLRRCLLREVEGGKAVVHDLVRGAVLQALAPGQAESLHGRAGKILAGGEDPTDALAAIGHFLAGEVYDLAETVAAERGHEIIEAGLAEAFLPLLERRAWTPSGSARRPRLLLLRGDALFALGRWSEAARAYEQCEDLLEALLGRAKAEVQRHSRLSLPLLLQAREQFEKTGALRLLAETEYWIGGVHENAGRLDDAAAAFERGRAVAYDVGDRRWEGLCAYGLGRLRSQRHDYVGAVEIEREALRLLEREGRRLDIAKVCAGLGGNLIELGRLDEAESYLERAVTEARATGATGILGSSLYNLASLRLEAKRVESALPYFSEALDVFEGEEQYDSAAWCAAWLAFGAWAEGREAEGDRWVERAGALLLRIREPALRARALRQVARACRKAGRREEAHRHLVRAAAEAREAKLPQLEADLATDLAQLD